MRYESDALQDRLAAEFVLGNLRGPARSRLVTLMRYRPGLRAKVAQWEERLFPLVMRAPAVKAPPRVWRAIHARISPHAASAWGARGWFRRFALSGLAAGLIAAGQDDGASEAGEAHGRRLPDARAGPGHDPDAVFDPRRPDGGHGPVPI